MPHCSAHFQCVARARRLVNLVSRRHANIEPQMRRTRRPNRNLTQRTRHRLCGILGRRMRSENAWDALRKLYLGDSNPDVTMRQVQVIPFRQRRYPKRFQALRIHGGKDGSHLQ